MSQLESYRDSIYSLPVNRFSEIEPPQLSMEASSPLTLFPGFRLLADKRDVRVRPIIFNA